MNKVGGKRVKNVKEEWKWIPSTRDTFPINAVQGGVENGNKIYVARAYHHSILTPGKFCVHHRNVSIPWNGQEYTTHNYEMLVAPPGTVEWVDYDYRSKQLPWNAIVGGLSDLFGERVYIGRCLHMGNILIGTVEPLRNTCYVSTNGQVLTFKKYFQILVHT